MRLLLVLAVSLVSASAGAQICPSLQGSAARSCVQSNYRPSSVQSSNGSKDRLYDTVDRTTQNGVDGVVGVYTGFFVPFDGVPSSDPSQDVFNNGSGINQEHVFPRSQGTDGNNAERDMHHLYPSRVQVNSDRGSLAFGSIPDNASSSTWYRDGSQQSATPAVPDEWSQRAGSRFEPRAEVRGDIARAMFYVAAVYASQIDQSWFDSQVDVLLQWHADDPATSADVARSNRVASFQSGCGAGACVNPFIEDATLAERVFGDPNAAPVAVDDARDTDQDQPVSILVLANDSDPDGDALTVSSVDAPPIGTATTDGTTVTFTPASGATGTVQFDYQISDGSLTASATITVTVNPVVASPAFAVSNPLDGDLYAWGDPLNVRWTTLDPSITATDRVQISLLCTDQAPVVVAANRANTGARGFLVPASVGTHGGPADSGACRAEVALVGDPSRSGVSQPFVTQDPAKNVTVTEPDRFSRYGVGDPFTFRWDTTDLPVGSTVDLSILCPGRADFVAFTNRPNNGARGFVLPTDFGAYTGCHAQVASSADGTVFGRSQGFEIRDVPLPSVTITLPTSATVWQAGTTRDITWTTESADATVQFRILLDRPGISAPVRIAQTDNDGLFEWAIPAGQAPGGGYRIRMTGLAQDGTRVRDVSETFKITAPPADRAPALAASVAAPETLTLESAVPNPSRSRARVRVGVPEWGWVRAEVVDVAGRVVATLADGELAPGWLDMDLDTGSLAAGVYLVRVQTATEVGTRTLTVVR